MQMENRTFSPLKRKPFVSRAIPITPINLRKIQQELANDDEEELEEEKDTVRKKDDSFDLNFSALTLSTPAKVADNNKIGHQFITPKNDFSVINRRRYRNTNQTTPNVLYSSSGKNGAIKLNTMALMPSFLEETDAAPLQDFKTLKVKNVQYIILNELGKGGSSEVLQCYDKSTGKHVAIKCVSLNNPTTAPGYLNEVKILQKLQGCDKIIKLFDFEILEEEKKLLVVLEKGGEDFSSILKQFSAANLKVPMYMLLFYWMEMLYAVREIHRNGIVHSDLKPANFLKAQSGLKLIDFGIASCLDNDMTSIVKSAQEGSCNYISPEALNSEYSTNKNSPNVGKAKFKVTYKTDVWSLGCILYQMVYRKTPFQHITTLWTKLSTILNPNHKIDYPKNEPVSPKILETIKRCLQYEVKLRPSVEELIAEYEEMLASL